MTEKTTGNIYCIRSNQTNELYIGGTCKSIHYRLYQHRNQYKNYMKGKYPYITAFEILKYDDNYIELIKAYENISKLERNKFEGEAIKSTPYAVNKLIIGSNKLERQKIYRINNIDKWKTYGKAYRTINSEKIKQDQKNYYDSHNYYYDCECGKLICRNNKSQHDKTYSHKTEIKFKNKTI